VVWRKRHFPKVAPRYRVHSILSVLELVALGMGVGIVPLFLAEGRKDIVRLTEPLDECETDLWLLTHPESRHLRRVGAVYSRLMPADGRASRVPYPSPKREPCIEQLNASEAGLMKNGLVLGGRQYRQLSLHLLACSLCIGWRHA
jgi:hypothetical protein